MIYLGSEYLASDLISYYTFPGLHIITCYNENNTQCAELYDMHGKWLDTIQRPKIPKHDTKIKFQGITGISWCQTFHALILPYLINELS